MKKDFDTIWNERRMRPMGKCPLSDERLTAMAAKAMNSAQPEQVDLTERRHRMTPRLIGWTAAAACTALVAIPISNNMSNTVEGVRLAKVDFNSQKVMMVCNNNCNANAVISSFDDYLKSI